MNSSDTVSAVGTAAMASGSLAFLMPFCRDANHAIAAPHAPRYVQSQDSGRTDRKLHAAHVERALGPLMAISPAA